MQSGLPKVTELYPADLLITCFKDTETWHKDHTCADQVNTEVLWGGLSVFLHLNAAFFEILFGDVGFGNPAHKSLPLPEYILILMFFAMTMPSLSVPKQTENKREGKKVKQLCIGLELKSEKKWHGTWGDLGTFQPYCFLGRPHHHGTHLRGECWV